jgi:peroxiredoxin
VKFFLKPNVILFLGLLVSLSMDFAEAKPSCLGAKGYQEGKCAIDFELSSLSGKSIRLSSLLGKVVFLHFWATWCEPCRAELVEMEKLNQRLSSDRFVMLAISLDQDATQVVPPYIRETLGSSSFEILLDPMKKVSQNYGTFKVPETYIIDKEGRIRDKIMGAYSWKDSLVIHYFQLLSQ